MCLTRAIEAQGGGLKGRGKSFAQVARVQSGCSSFVLFKSSSCASFCNVALLALLIDAEGVCVLSVLQECPCRWKHAFTLLAGEVGGLLRHWQTRWTKLS